MASTSFIVIIIVGYYSIQYTQAANTQVYQGPSFMLLCKSRV